MKICFLPIDNRPVCYTLPSNIAAIDGDIQLFLPPREYLGDLTKHADTEKLLDWLTDLPECDAVILSLDTVAYGGLISSRRGTESFEQIRSRIFRLKDILQHKNAQIYAFSSIMRISNNNYNEEEKEYWKDYGKKIFKYSYEMHKTGSSDASEIPPEILKDYLDTRRRNFEINKIYLEWQKEDFFNTLIFSKDDCAEFGFNVQEAYELESLGGFTKTGADEIPLTLLARSLKKDIKVFVQYTEPDCRDLISNYEDVSIEKSVNGQLELGGFVNADSKEDADIVLVVNNFKDRQGELVMGWNTQPFDKIFIPPDKPFAVADVRYANGADNNFVNQLIKHIYIPSHQCLTFSPQERKNFFLGYSGWNTSANTVGSLLAGVKVTFNAKKYNEKSFKELQIIRFLDDWAYQANVRGKTDKPCDITRLMKPYEEILSDIFDCKINAKYSYPWNRKFETEINL